ncbi:hypothetical protein FOZG_17638 [Fusarium oxysporum Fo47]|uniref:Uncharacterized protein n=1 Tax=Fusarium oxysporum Fo47 TaxID=660027 RepID=W9JGP8_FUSOX|nr:hypothetical protein FOZG_17638 [Fusarium oxysporum Fo47]
MATLWPQDEIWPTDYREHVPNLSKYFQKALSANNNGNGQPIASHGVRVAPIGALSLIVKIKGTPDKDGNHSTYFNILNGLMINPGGVQAAAEAAKRKRVSGQYATAEIGQAASELQKGQRTMWGPCVKVEGTRGPRKSSSRRLFVLFGQPKLL